MTIVLLYLSFFLPSNYYLIIFLSFSLYVYFSLYLSLFVSLFPSLFLCLFLSLSPCTLFLSLSLSLPSGPLPHTIDDFWRMIWETGCEMIIMVTNPVEGGTVSHIACTCTHVPPLSPPSLSLSIYIYIESMCIIIINLEIDFYVFFVSLIVKV